MFKRLIAILEHYWDDPMEMWYTVQGWTRYNMHKLGILRPELVKMVEERKALAFECYENGSCIICGCTTPHMFYADRSCKRKEYGEGPNCYEKR